MFQWELHVASGRYVWGVWMNDCTGTKWCVAIPSSSATECMQNWIKWKWLLCDLMCIGVGTANASSAQGPKVSFSNDAGIYDLKCSLLKLFTSMPWPTCCATVRSVSHVLSLFPVPYSPFSQQWSISKQAFSHSLECSLEMFSQTYRSTPSPRARSLQLAATCFENSSLMSLGCGVEEMSRKAWVPEDGCMDIHSVHINAHLYDNTIKYWNKGNGCYYWQWNSTGAWSINK